MREGTDDAMHAWLHCTYDMCCPVLLQDAFDIIESFDDGVDYGILDDPNKMITPEVRRRGSVAENVFVAFPYIPVQSLTMKRQRGTHLSHH